MPNDLEEFLRQAAAMRQRKMVQRRADADRQRERRSRTRPRPYSDARREREAEDDAGYYDDLDEEVFGEQDIEILDAVHLDSDDRDRDGMPRERSLSTMARAKIRSPDRNPSQHSQERDSPADALREMFRRPDGLRQAFLIREVLNRPRF
ncbi:hypothetical protein [Allorhodopirellula solitaria]|uniref:Uncharacterized protein n=1 Tax=Allorhodopirellula solitaria TaxID=2527987 RepID=A0A5C5YDT7_9BACT|nr:hypothetical protein [Allorhodopirellula solitaria]TWT73896.1 hypothetical protein CA85_07780 [Allorhodopirellula solitaria]